MSNGLENVGPASLNGNLRLHLNPLTLSFTGDHGSLEKLFRQTSFASSIDHLRRCNLYAILFFSIFGMLDAYVFPEQKYQLWFIRYCMVCPVFFLGLVFSYSAAYRRLWQPINAIYIIVTGFAYVVMVAITPAPKSYFYGVGTIFCVVFGYTFINARFITASIAGILVTFGYEASLAWLIEADSMVQVITGTHFIGLNCLGMLICYSIETRQRRGFYLNYLLEKEKRKTEHINQGLERRVEERTAALKRINRELNKEIQERKEAQARLRNSHEQLTTILDSIDVDIHVADMETDTILLANRHMKKTYGEELVGKTCHETIFGKHAPCIPCRDDLLLDENGRPGNGHFWEQQLKEHERWYIVYARAIVWEDGRLVQLQVSTDITETKKMEARLQRAQKMESIGALAGGVAHDLNNILSGLVGYPELLLLDMPKDGETRVIVETIKQSGVKAAAIVQDLLTLARRGVAVTDVVGINQVVEQYMNSLELVKLKSFHADVIVETDLSPTVFNIIGSPTQLQKTIMNLVTNASEAMPDGGLIRIRTSNCYVDQPIQGFETIPEGEYVRLQVADNGIGIPAKNLERIFEPFYTRKKMGRSGTGLGMAVVWGTVKDHNGYIDAHSLENEGTVFDLYFPLTRKKEEARNDTVPIDRYRGSGETVLVVDDIKEQRDMAEFMLKRLDYDVTSVASGEEAVAYVRNRPVDILVLDMILESDMDGLDTYRQILALYPGQKAIIASGFSESEHVLEAQRLGAGVHIKKPYHFEQIAAAIKDELTASPPEST
ncbi:MAG: hypothetical protein CSA23_05135 [Deltaproteobacteria bacterium]|nr:MAG: hypothetical protein CSA23_05135 [Deltaproteobacteria bacterium]